MFEEGKYYLCKQCKEANNEELNAFITNVFYANYYGVTNRRHLRSYSCGNGNYYDFEAQTMMEFHVGGIYKCMMDNYLKDDNGQLVYIGKLDGFLFEEMKIDLHGCEKIIGAIEKHYGCSASVEPWEVNDGIGIRYICNIIANNSGKKGIFKGVDEITFFFEWYGNKSFAGFHKEGDEMHLALIDVFLKKKGYIEPNTFIDIFCDDARIETPSVIYIGKLDMNFANSIVNNDWTKDDCQYPEVKEGVVCKRSTLMKGQRLPMCKIKTNWWLTELHNNFSEEECKLLE